MKNKIRALLSLYNENYTSYANYLGISKQGLHNKGNKEAYKLRDIIKLADFTNTRLAFIDEKGDPVIIFNLDDISKNKRENDE